MEIVNSNGICIIFDESLSKNTLFLARQVLSKLDFHFNSLDTLKRTFSLSDDDLIKVEKKNNALIFLELSKLDFVGERASELVLITEIGFWKVLLQSKSEVGKELRQWCVDNVLVSISNKRIQSEIKSLSAGNKHVEAVIEDLWKSGIGLDRIKEVGLHVPLIDAFDKMLSLGVDIDKLGSSAKEWRDKNKK